MLLEMRKEDGEHTTSRLFLKLSEGEINPKLCLAKNHIFTLFFGQC
jgi:hypothetical protein